MIRYDKQSICLSKEARKHGVNAMTAHNRLERGWTLEDAVSKPPDPTFLRPELRKFKTKEEGQWLLDETPYDKLPAAIKQALQPSSRQMKFGKLIRRHHNPVFLKWYEESFKNS